MKKIILVLALSLSIAGCAGFAPVSSLPAASPSTQPSAAPSTPQGLEAFTLSDAQAALSDATAHNDVVAVTCYSWLIGKLQTLPQVTTPSGTIGLIEAHQIARDAKLALGGLQAQSQGAAAACGGMILDDETAFAAIGSLFIK